MMTTATDHIFNTLGALLEYPGDGFDQRLAEAQKAVPADVHPQAHECIRHFGDTVEGQKITELEELYTRTFDINPVCSLEVGWQLYGEEYKRGQFLVTMRSLLRRFAIPESVELPDHLPQVLRLLDKMDGRQAMEFADTYAIPAIAKMIRGFKDKENPYQHVLKAVLQVLECNVKQTRGTESHE